MTCCGLWFTSHGVLLLFQLHRASSSISIIRVWDAGAGSEPLGQPRRIYKLRVQSIVKYGPSKEPLHANQTEMRARSRAAETVDGCCSLVARDSGGLRNSWKEAGLIWSAAKLISRFLLSDVKDWSVNICQHVGPTVCQVPLASDSFIFSRHSFISGVQLIPFSFYPL